LHHFYDPFPTVEHYEPVLVSAAQPVLTSNGRFSL
jgi:hypothetical protein